jgi:polyisoprenoid-binding protein YceI
VGVTIAADSLRNDQPALSPEDHETVNRQVQGPDILDVQRHPEIRFVGKQLDVKQLEPASLEGVLHGMLTLRGETAPIELRVHAAWSADRLNANARSSFPQSAFGIEPYRRLLGTIAVRDEVQVELSIEAVRE